LTFVDVFYQNDLTINANQSNSSVYYRQVTDSASLQLITSEIRSALPQYAFFNATSAYVITWYRIQYKNTPNFNTFQTVLASDGSYSFVLNYYSQLDSLDMEPNLCNFQDNYNASNNFNFACALNQSSWNKPGSFIFNVDGTGNLRQIVVILFKNNMTCTLSFNI
jgi:hypothetical protein